ncbi:hypothetical protein GYMLUDRAFT_235996 [Collybiopsis luxurians FD-317 M1]|nr:hypothetical protein GYMLUDRAFT_235996 [Collybiopsis luxurians FD-317 M1]
MSWTNEVTILIDDSHFLYSGTRNGTSWNWWIAPNMYNDTVAFGSANGSEGFELSFTGSAISLFGLTPNSSFPQTVSVANGAESSPFKNVSLPSPATYSQFYTSPDQPLVLQANGTQNFIGTKLITAGLQLDYGLIKVTNSTDFEGQIILVDDSNDEIEWNGLWEENNGTMVSNSQSAGSTIFLPHGNSTQKSTTEGDSFVFQFAGVSIAIAGINPQAPGSGLLTMNFTVDGDSTQKSFAYELDDHSGPQPGFTHFTYFSIDSLDPGNHVLIAKITHIEGNISASIDYLTYEPSFDHLIDKPKFAKFGSSASSSTSSSVSSSTSSGSSGGVSEAKINGGVVAGIVLGVIVFMSLMVGIGLCWLRKQRLGKRKESRMTAASGTRKSDKPLYGMRALGVIFYIGVDSKHIVPDPYLLSAPEVQTGTSRKRQELRREREELVQSMRELQRSLLSQHMALEIASASTRPSSDGSLAEDLQAQIRDMQARMELITNEVNRYMEPPAYEIQNRTVELGN